MNPDDREEIVLQGEQVEQQSIAAPAQETHKGPRYRIQNEVVGCRDDGDQDQEWIGEAREAADQTAPRNLQPENPCPPARTSTSKDVTVPWWKRDGHDRESNHERISKMQRRHGGW